MNNSLSLKHKSLPSSLRDYLVLSLYPIHLFDKLKLSNPTNRNTFKEIVNAYSGVPNIFAPFDIGFIRERHLMITIHPWYKHGSLRDMIYNTKPTASFDDKQMKRNESNKGVCLTEEQVRRYGKQILEALLTFRQTGVVFTHRTYCSS